MGLPRRAIVALRKPSGHCGIKKTYHKLAARFYWPKMRADVRQFVKKCKLCQQCKAANGPPLGLMTPKEAELTPFLSLAIDLIGALPMTLSRHRYILIAVDYATKFVIAKPLRTATAQTVVDCVEKYILLR